MYLPVVFIKPEVFPPFFITQSDSYTKGSLLNSFLLKFLSLRHILTYPDYTEKLSFLKGFHFRH